MRLKLYSTPILTMSINSHTPVAFACARFMVTLTSGAAHGPTGMKAVGVGVTVGVRVGVGVSASTVIDSGQRLHRTELLILFI